MFWANKKGQIWSVSHGLLKEVDNRNGYIFGHMMAYSHSFLQGRLDTQLLKLWRQTKKKEKSMFVTFSFPLMYMLLRIVNLLVSYWLKNAMKWKFTWHIDTWVSITEAHPIFTWCWWLDIFLECHREIISVAAAPWRCKQKFAFLLFSLCSCNSVILQIEGCGLHIKKKKSSAILSKSLQLNWQVIRAHWCTHGWWWVSNYDWLRMMPMEDFIPFKLAFLFHGKKVRLSQWRVQEFPREWNGS